MKENKQIENIVLGKFLQFVFVQFIINYIQQAPLIAYKINHYTKVKFRNYVSNILLGYFRNIAKILAGIKCIFSLE